MATIAELVDAGSLFKLDPVLEPNKQEFRIVYTSPRLKDWLLTELPMLASSWDIETTPSEQLDALIAVYASGEPLTFERQFNPINPIGEGVWELKTADLRILGWFAVQDCFVGVVGDTAERVKRHGLYAGYRGEAVRFREALPLDEPKFVEGDDPDAVVSNFTFP